ncbi:MAG: hypothetical protein C4331_00940 [Meiothermus sp.]
MPGRHPSRRPLRLSQPSGEDLTLEGVQTLLASKGSEQLYEQVLEHLEGGLKGAEQALVWVKDSHRRFQLTAARGIAAEMVRGLEGVPEATLRSGYAGSGWPDAAPVVLDQAPHPLPKLLGDRLPPGLEGLEPATVFTLPLKAHGEVWAVVQLLASDPFDERETEWATQYLLQISPILREFHLRESAERQALWLSAINTLLRAPRDQALEVTLGDALEEITRLSGAEGARLVVLGGGALHTVAGAGWGSGLPVETAIGRQLAERAQRGEQVSIPRYDLYPDHRDELTKAGLRSLFLLPIQRERDETSVLMLFSTRHHWLPDSQTQTLLSDMAAAIGVVRREWKLQRELAWAAYTDPLTGLGNRRAFERDLEYLASKPPGRTVVLVLLDLDGFKRMNDTYGHVHADHVLVRLGGALRAKARAGDRAYRLGGDEFALIIEGPQSLNPSRTAERYRALVEEIRVSDSEYLQASLGWAVPQDSSDLHGLWREADDAMYRDKAVRKNQSPLFVLPQGRESILPTLNSPLARVARRLGYAWGLLGEEIDVLMASCFLLEGGGKVVPTSLPEGVRNQAARVLTFMGTRWDGSGEPAASGERIPKATRILQLAQRLVSRVRPGEGHPAHSLEETLGLIEAEAGSRFDPELVDLLLRLKNELGLEDPAA